MNLYKIQILLLFLFVSLLTAQTKTEKLLNTPQSKFLNYSKETSFCDFIDYVDFLYGKYENKKVVVNTDCRFPINVNLTEVMYSKALEEVCVNNGLSIIDKGNEILISKKDTKEKITENNIDDLLKSKQVKISAILFEANLDAMKERGVDWNFNLSKSGLKSYGGFHSKGEQKGFVSVQVAGDVYKFSGFTAGLFKFFESENLGKIISKMSVTVRDGKTGKMQVGSDVSIKQLDFAGNVTDAFFPTGTIINVEPKVYSKDNNDYALVKVKVERSIPYPDEVSTIIKKTLTDTEVLLRNNEQSVIGTLLVEENGTVREGIPVLKDLPWWVLGLRYLTGYDSKIAKHKEVVMLMKAEIIPPVTNAYDNENIIDENLKFKSNELHNLNDKQKPETEDNEVK